MNLNSLTKVKMRDKKRIGRGIGSGKGKTSARGTKGQKARGKIPAAVVGGGLNLYKKLPYNRGFARHGGNPARVKKPVIIKTSKLNNLKPNTTLDLSKLVELKLITEKEIRRGVKVLVDEALRVSLNVSLPVSKSAKSAIEKAGGKVV